LWGTQFYTILKFGNPKSINSLPHLNEWIFNIQEVITFIFKNNSHLYWWPLFLKL